MAAQNPNVSEAPGGQVQELGEEYDDNGINTSESDSENEAPPIALRWSPRLSGAEPEYHGLFGSLCTPDEESAILRNDYAFLGQLDLDDGNQFGTSATMRYLNQSSYIANGFSVGNDHPYEFSVKV